MHFNICMRFHSHIFSILTKVPFISLCHTEKVRLLLKDCNIEDLYY